MEIAATMTLLDLEDKNRYSVERGVAVFGPHTRKVVDPDTMEETGVVKYEVSERDLDEICRNSNEAAKKCHFGRQTIGHVKFNSTPESLQPADLVGHVANYRVGRLPDGSPVVIADLYTRNELKEKASKFPYRSAEYRFKEKRICGVARLLRDPELMLGTASLGGSSDVECYGDAYVSSANESSHGVPDGMIAAGDLSPDEMATADRIFFYLCSKYKSLKEVCCGEQPKTTNNDSSTEPEKYEMNAPKADEVDTGVSSGISVEAYQALEQKFNSMAESHKKMFLENERFKVERMLDSLDVEKYQFDREEAISVMIPRDDAGRKKFVEFIKGCKRIVGDDVSVLQGDSLVSTTSSSGISKAVYDKAWNHMRRTSCTWEDALAATQGK